MKTYGLFGKTISLMEKALDLRSKKHNLIASNIANVDTPNYRSFDLLVEEELKKTTSLPGKIELEKTHRNHLSFNKDVMSDVKYTLNEEENIILRSDNNTVDLDKEMAKMAKNNILYNALARIISKKFQGLKTVIQEGK